MTLQFRQRNVLDFIRNLAMFNCRFRHVSRWAAISATKCVYAGVAALLIYFLLLRGATDLYAQQAPPAAQGYVQLDNAQLDQLVAPIALYADALVAQILAATTYPAQIVEADRFVQQNKGLSQQDLARKVNAQPWDPSVKALTAFPSVLSSLDRNLEWTSKLGNAYYNQPQNVMSAVQTMRHRAYEAGNLKTTPQETVIYQQPNIVIQPANPAVVYVPTYNPWIVYGAPVPVYPAFYFPPIVPVAGVAVFGSFSAGVFVGSYGSFSWGYANWSPNWSSHTIVYNQGIYISGSTTVVNHGYYGGYDHSAAAVAYNHQVAIGPNGGVATRSVTRGDGQTNVNVTGPNGNTATRSTTFNSGGNSTTVTGPNGETVNRTVTGRGTGDVTATTTGPNGNTASRSTTFNSGGSSTTVTGPNGQTANRTVTGRGTGDVTATTTGPNGNTANRSTTFNSDGRSTTVTGPNGETANRAVTGRVTGEGMATTTGPRGRQFSSQGAGGVSRRPHFRR